MLKIIWTYVTRSSVLLQIRACILTYTHNKLDRRDDIRSALQNIIQRELHTYSTRADPASRTNFAPTRSGLAQAEVVKERLRNHQRRSFRSREERIFNSAPFFVGYM